MISRIFRRIRCFFLGHEIEETVFRNYGNHFVLLVRCENCGMNKIKDDQ